MSTVTINASLSRRSLIDELRELWSYRELIWTMIERDLRVRYKGSVLGIFWSMIVPIMQAFTYTIVMGKIMNSGQPNTSVLILCALIPWIFFQSALLDSSQVILSQMMLIKKVYFPREIPVIASVGANLIHLGTSLIVFVVYRWLVVPILHGGGWPGLPPWQIVFLPIVVLELGMLSLGLSFLVCALNVFYEDVKFIVQQCLQVGMFLSAVIYPVERIFYSPGIPAGLRWFLYHFFLLNPIAWIVTAFKQMFLPPQPTGITTGIAAHSITAPFNPMYCAIAFVTSSIIWYLGYSAFNKVKWRFTERP